MLGTFWARNGRRNGWLGAPVRRRSAAGFCYLCKSVRAVVPGGELFLLYTASAGPGIVRTSFVNR